MCVVGCLAWQTDPNDRSNSSSCCPVDYPNNDCRIRGYWAGPHPSFSGCSSVCAERLLWEQEAAGSSPAIPTIKQFSCAVRLLAAGLRL